MRCATWCIPRGVSSFVFIDGRLAVPLVRHGFKARHVLFRADGVVSQQEVRRKGRDDETIGVSGNVYVVGNVCTVACRVCIA